MLTVVAVKAAGPKDRDYKLADGGGLYLFVTKSGHRSWRWKYRWGGKEKRLVLGSFPELSLATAREQRDAARRQLQEGKDPGLVRKRAKLVRSTPSSATFENVARQWHAHEKARWKPVHANDVITSLERDIFPDLGAFDLADIDEQMVIATLGKVEARGAVETAHRLRQRLSAVFRYGKAKGLAHTNPTADVAAVMQHKPKSGRRPAIVVLPELRKVLEVTEHAGASPVTKCASRFLALTAQRPGMVHRLPWADIHGVDWTNPDGDDSAAVWRVPAAEMKQEFDLREDEAFDHAVPLAPQAVAVLRAIRPLTGTSAYVFPSSRSMADPISENAIGYLYNREGFKGRHCPHGWRSSFSTIVNEMTAREVKSDEAKAFYRLVIDLMLAHLPKGVSETERIYNRAAYVDTRRALACSWADLLLEGLGDAAGLLGGPRRRYRD